MAKRKFPEKKSVAPFEAPEAKLDAHQEDMPAPAHEQAAAPKFVCATCSATYGVVSGCKLLNVRSKPDISATVVGTQPEGCTLFVNERKSTKDWYYVSANGIQGYCMRKYVAIVE